MMERGCLLMLVTGLLGRTAWAAEYPMVGDWKLNPKKSTLTDVMKMETSTLSILEAAIRKLQL